MAIVNETIFHVLFRDKMPVCCYEGCFSGSKCRDRPVNNRKIHAHKFPTNSELRFQWLQQIQRGTNIKEVNFEKGMNIIY